MNKQREIADIIEESVQPNITENPKLVDMFPNKFVDETGIISSGTSITGDVTTRGNLTVKGQIEGNIKAEGDVYLTGALAGDMTCKNLNLSGKIKNGYVNVKNNITINFQAEVHGDIKCNKIIVNGVVNGNIDAAESISVLATAVVKGNINTRALEMSPEAQLQGCVMVER